MLLALKLTQSFGLPLDRRFTHTHTHTHTPWMSGGQTQQHALRGSLNTKLENQFHLNGKEVHSYLWTQIERNGL